MEVQPTGAASEAFARWLRRRQIPDLQSLHDAAVELPSSGRIVWSRDSLL